MIVDLTAHQQRRPVHESLSKLVSQDRAERSLALGESLRTILAAGGGTGTVPPGLDQPMGFGLLHHALYHAATAARERDPQRVDNMRELVGAIATAPVEHAALCVVPAAACQRIVDARFASPVYAVTAEAIDADAAPGRLLDDAVRLLVRADKLGWVREGGAVLVLCDELDGSDGTGAFSYSIGILPYTVFTDWLDDPVVLAECLLHESAHCWLNMVLTACDEHFPAEPVGFSPWKGVDRPAFGLIHAGLAFGLVASFLETHIDNAALTDDQRKYCEVRSQVERIRLRQARDGITKALSFVRSTEVAGLIAGIAFAED
jgi:HEXXH motif-containing protein